MSDEKQQEPLSTATRALLRACADYHKTRAANHREVRVMRERSNIGPPHSVEHERQHEQWAKLLVNLADREGMK